MEECSGAGAAMVGQQFMESAPTTMISVMDGPRANFRIGEVFDADDPSAGYVVRLSMAFNDMRTNYGLIERSDRTGPAPQWLVRVVVGQIRETAFIITPPKPTSIITLEEYLSAEPGEEVRCGLLMFAPCHEDSVASPADIVQDHRRRLQSGSAARRAASRRSGGR
jgi:hypothetical protein